jgi:Calcineurin-like phosphoesterase
MPDPERLLRTVRQATIGFRNTPGRQGRSVELEDVDDVLVGGDLHGNVENFRGLLQRADLAQHPRRHLVLQELIHGPFLYAEGGDRSHQLVDLLAALKCQYPGRVNLLLGNHELAQWTDRTIFKGDVDLNAQFRRGIATAYGERAEEMYAAYLELFAAVPLAVRTPNRVLLSHSIPSAKHLSRFDPDIIKKEDPDPSAWKIGGSLYALLWGRDQSPATVNAFLEKMDADHLISGHIPCEQGYSAPNPRQIILDSGGTPAGYCLFPADRRVSHAQLVACVGTL